MFVVGRSVARDRVAGQPSIAGLAVLRVELAHRARNHKIVVIEHKLARDAVLVELERHRVDRRLLAFLLLGLAVEIADGDGPALERFHVLVGRRGIGRAFAFGRDRLADHGQRVVDLLAIVGAVIDRELEQRLAVLRGGNDALDLFGREYDLSVERKALRRRQLQLDIDVVAVALRRTVDPAGVSLVHPRLDLEAVAFTASVLPGIGAEVAERDLTLAAVELGDLAEFGGVALARTSREIVEDAAARAVDRIGARFHQAQIIERLMREERTVRGQRTASGAESGRRERRHTERSPEKVQHVWSLGESADSTF